MAITLSVPLTDAEQATVVKWLDALLPGRTAAQKKAALEGHAKRLLRDDLARRMANTRRQAVLDAGAKANQDTRDEAAAIAAADPFAPPD